MIVVKYHLLGYSISKEGISLGKTLIEKIQKIATPTNEKELEYFGGLVNFYRRYVPKYTDLIQLLTNLRKKNVEFIWSEEQQKAFDRLKVIMAKKPAVNIFDPRKDITLTTDVSEHSKSGILSQEGHLIKYSPRRLMNTKFNYSNIEKEAFAIVWTTTRARQFLNGKNYKSLTIRVYIQSKKRITQSHDIENTKMSNKINGI